MKQLIKKYIEKLSIQDLEKHIDKYGINLNHNELEIIYYYLKNNWENLLYNDNEIDNLQNKINNEAFLKLKNIFLDYKHKYQSFL